MGLMELGCTRRGFGRDVQPAAPNRPRCWVLVGLTLGVRLVGAGRFCTAFCTGTGFGSGGEPVDGYGTRVCVSRKLHPLGGEHALLLKKGPGRPGAWGIRNETWPASCDDDGFLSREDLIGGAGIRMKRWLRPCCERGCRRL